MSILYSLLGIVISYVIGSFPTGYIVARLYGIPDIRAHGSGNIGATNVARSLGIQFFIPIFLLDAVKAYVNIMVLISMGYDEWIVVAAALAHLIGNGCSVFLQGQGGKGVATSVGLFAALQPCVLPYIFMVWAIFFMFMRTVGFASVITALLLPLSIWVCGYSYSVLLFSLFVSVWVLLRHHANIRTFLVKKY